MSLYRAVALDLDGTIVTGGVISTAAMEATDALRGSGIRVLLVTGRILARLDEEFPGLTDRFDAVVAENDAVLRTAQPAAQKPFCATTRPDTTSPDGSATSTLTTNLPRRSTPSNRL